MKEQKDVRQRIEEGEFAQSAEISASYLDEDILIIDNVKVLQNPDPMRFQMNMIASCQRGSLRAELNGREFTVEKGDIFISPPNSILDIKEVSEDFACTAMCVSNHGLLEYPSFSYLGMEPCHVCEQGFGVEDERGGYGVLILSLPTWCASVWIRSSTTAVRGNLIAVRLWRRS